MCIRDRLSPPLNSCVTSVMRSKATNSERTIVCASQVSSAIRSGPTRYRSCRPEMERTMGCSLVLYGSPILLTLCLLTEHLALRAWRCDRPIPWSNHSRSKRCRCHGKRHHSGWPLPDLAGSRRQLHTLRESLLPPEQPIPEICLARNSTCTIGIEVHPGW